MQVIRALYDGIEIKPIEPIRTRKKTEVLIIFPDEEEKIPSKEARKLLRGCGRGEKLTEKLLKSRREDMLLEER